MMLRTYLNNLLPILPAVAGVLLLLLQACDQGGSSGGQRRGRSEVTTIKNEGDGSAVTGSGNTQQGVTDTVTNEQDFESTEKVEGGFISRTLSYGSEKGMDLTGFYLAPEGLTSMGPGIVLIHGTSGLSPSFKKNMEQFADQGYRVFAPDLFMGTVPESREEGEALLAKFNARGRQTVLGLISAASQYLFDTIKVSAVGLVGWGDGGYWSIATFLTFKKQFSAVVNFMGSPFELKKQPSEISAPMLHIFVQDDSKIDITEVITLEQDLKTSSRYPVTFQKFQGVDRYFLDPELSEGEKDRDNIALAYKFTLDFLDKYLKDAVTGSSSGSSGSSGDEGFAE